MKHQCKSGFVTVDYARVDKLQLPPKCWREDRDAKDIADQDPMWKARMTVVDLLHTWRCHFEVTPADEIQMLQVMLDCAKEDLAKEETKEVA